MGETDYAGGKKKWQKEAEMKKKTKLITNLKEICWWVPFWDNFFLIDLAWDADNTAKMKELAQRGKVITKKSNPANTPLIHKALLGDLDVNLD